MDYNTLLRGKKHIHFIGIGGSGMYPLVQILNSEGYFITGSDNNESDTLKAVCDLGIRVYLGQSADNIAGADLIVHTAAIMSDNPELSAARQSGVVVLERSELLGALTSRYKQAICIAGTHGKTTTTAMLTQIILDAGDYDPTIFIGGKLASIGGNGKLGKSDTMICEACEFANTFLKMHPDISVILNIDEDHLDFFKTLDNLINSFHKFCEKTTNLLIINGGDQNTLKAVKGLDKRIITFGKSDNNDYYAANIVKHEGFRSSFDLMSKGEKLVTLTMNVPGSHNILNATAACAAALSYGLEPGQLVKGMENFKGAGRRFEILGEINGAVVADDYAHHPAEVKVTLETAKSLGYNRVIAVHQPFTFSRTAMLLDDFADALSIADMTVLSPIMGSREKNTYNIYSQDLADKMENCRCFETFEKISEFIKSEAKAGDLIITLGCGDIYKAAKLILKIS